MTHCNKSIFNEKLFANIYCFICCLFYSVYPFGKSFKDLSPGVDPDVALAVLSIQFGFKAIEEFFLHLSRVPAVLPFNLRARLAMKHTQLDSNIYWNFLDLLS